MRYFFFHFLVMVLIAVFFGCDSQPLDVLIDQSEKSTTDLVSEVSDCFTGLEVDTPSGEYRATFDKTCVDTVLGVASVDTTPISDIVSDTSSGGSAYEGQILTITGTVKETFSSSEAITLESDDDSVTFFVISWGTPERLSEYEVGETYDFDVYIQDQAESSTAGNYNVWTDLVYSAEAETVSLDTLIANAKSGDQQYAQRVITLQATVSSISTSVIFLRDNAADVLVKIHRSGHADEADYQVNQTYTFKLFVFKIGDWTLENWYEVRLGLVRSE